MAKATATPMLAPKQYPFYLGGLAASIAACVTHPLDVTKVRMQTLTGQAGSGGGQTSRPSMLKTMISISRSDGMRGLYVGLTASIFRQMTYSVVRFGSYEAIKEKMRTEQASPGPLAVWQLALAAGIGGAAGGIAGNGPDVILIRMTSDGNKASGKRLHYTNAWNGLIRMIREEGVGSLFRGLGPNVSRAVLMNSSQLASYDLFKAGLQNTWGYKDGLSLHFFASFLAGTCATTICSPFDVIKSRIQSASSQTSVLQIIRSSWAKEGIYFAFKGWTPAWIRLTPNSICIFLVLERLRLATDYLRGS